MKTTTKCLIGGLSLIGFICLLPIILPILTVLGIIVVTILGMIGSIVLGFTLVVVHSIFYAGGLFIVVLLIVGVYKIVQWLRKSK